MTEERSYHWESKVKCVFAPTATELAKELNDVYPKLFVVGTKIFPVDDDMWVAFVSYKVRVKNPPRRTP